MTAKERGRICEKKKKFMLPDRLVLWPLKYRVSQEECARFREGVSYAKVYRYDPKHLCPKFNGYGDNGQ